MKKNLTLILLLFSSLMLFAQTYEQAVLKAMDCIDQKDYLSAEQSFKAALNIEPANPANTMLIVNLGTVLRYQGKFDEALFSYNIAIEKYPNVHFLRQSRALLYFEMGRFEDALKDYNTILLSDPDNIEVLYERGLLNMKNRNLLAAEEDFDKISKLDINNILSKKGMALIMKTRGEWDNAEEMYSELIDKNNNNGELFFHRAECFLKKNKLARAQGDLNKALELGYDNPEFYILRGQLRLLQFDKQAAKKDFLKAKEMGAEPDLVEEYLKQCK